MKVAFRLLLLFLGVSFASVPAVYSGGQFIYLPLIFQHSQNNANSFVPPYQASFQYGLNPGYYGNGWNDQAVFGLCHSAGCRSFRGSLPDSFLAQWGAGIELNDYQHAVNELDFQELTVFLGQPRPEWRDPTFYDGHQSLLWQGMYEPIWDNGENGTPINDNNRFAHYVWLVVSNYGQHIRFYEIINEPDYTNSSFGWVEPGTPGNWWENPPQPQDLPNLRAPVYQYIRLLRIAYEVVKRYDSTAYVTPGGLGYASFADVLLRYSDNPAGGVITADYPFTGGAYFDALSIHVYPQFGARFWDGSQWVPDRHSDKAVEVTLNSLTTFEETLAEHGYDGSTYPKKVFLITEINIARKQIGETLGGVEVQRNFTIKVLAKLQQVNLAQVYWYTTGETKNYDDPSAGSFNLMGFYENLTRDQPGQEIITQQGIANRTTFSQLYGWEFDAAATAGLNLPPTADGVAFRQGNQVRYVVWAKTTQDQSEVAAVTITLPGSYDVVAWDGTTSVVSGSNLALTGVPIFLTPVEN